MKSSKKLLNNNFFSIYFVFMFLTYFKMHVNEESAKAIYVI